MQRQAQRRAELRVRSYLLQLWVAIAAVGLYPGMASPAFGYEGELHQQFMFLAARQYNECVKETPEQRLTALQVRYAARAAVSQADASFLRRMFRWGFYERNAQAPKSTLWVIETRMHEHFNKLLGELEQADSAAEQFIVVGRIAAYVQDVTSPVRTVPIYTARFWRLNTNDRFDNFALNARDLETALAGSCTALFADESDYAGILRDSADATLVAIEQPIPGMPTTWQSFWQLAKDPTEFGEYGVAGNRFGQRTAFRCGEDRCVLLDDDPLYLDFAAAQHLLAVVSTMRVLHRLQLSRTAFADDPPASNVSASEVSVNDE